jgi:hypothetical protein
VNTIRATFNNKPGPRGLGALSLVGSDGWSKRFDEPIVLDDERLSDIEPRFFVCKACGKRGADVRPHFEPARMLGITN